jgi:hypothetical protein
MARCRPVPLISIIPPASISTLSEGKSAERRHYYELLREIGGGQSEAWDFGKRCRRGHCPAPIEGRDGEGCL